MRKRNVRAFSLLEILLVVMLMAVLIGAGLVNTRRATSRGEANGVAELVAEELRGARNLAMSQHEPVAMVFPSGGGTRGDSQGFYILQGADHPKVVRSQNYSREYPGARIFVGLWPTSATVGRDDLQGGAQGQNFTVSQWAPPVTNDYIVMFTPSGTVKTNGIPQFDGNHHLVVCEGVTATSSGAPAGSQPLALNYFQMSSVAQPNTISVGPSGSVVVEPGLKGDNGGVAIVNTAMPGGPAAPPLSASVGANSSPVITSCQLDPDRITPYELQPRQLVNLVVYASDPDGDPLMASWTATPNLGKFSSPSEGRMEWVPSKTGPGSYRCVWTWTPPDTMGPGTPVSLNCQVRDGRGGVASSGLPGTMTMQRESRLAFVRSKIGGTGSDILIGTPDGSTVKFASPPDDNISLTRPSPSPDGSLLAGFGRVNGSTGLNNFYIVSTEGKMVRNIFTPAFAVNIDCGKRVPAWSADGKFLVLPEWGGGLVKVNALTGASVHLTTTPNPGVDQEPDCSPVPIAGEYRVVFYRSGVTWNTIYSIRLSDGGDPKILSGPQTDDYLEPTWAPNGSHVVYSDNYDNIWLATPDGATRNKVLQMGGPFGSVCCSTRFSPDGNLIAFIHRDGASFTSTIWVTKANGSHPDSGVANSAKQLHTTPNLSSSGCNFWWSPDSQELVFANSNATTGELYRVNVFGAPNAKKLMTHSDPNTKDTWPVWFAR